MEGTGRQVGDGVQQVEDREFRKFVLRVETLDGRVLGTAFYAAPGRALTCAHVVGELPRLRVVPADALDSEPIPATVLARSEIGWPGQAPWPFPDLAVLDLHDFDDHPCPPLLAGSPDRGQPSYSFGFSPRQSERPVGSPRTFDYEGAEGDGYLTLKQGQAKPGISGAPLLCPLRRAIVGVVAVSRNIDTDLGGWASPLAALLDEGYILPKALAEAGSDIRVRNPPAAMRWRSAWQRVLPVDGSGTLGKPWDEFHRQPTSNPSDLLVADFAVVPYLFRDSYLDDMQRWCDSHVPMAIGTVTAYGGAGKTRFAIELCRRMEQHGWVTGFWRRGGTEIAAVAAPRLVVVDYTEEVEIAALQELISLLQEQPNAMTPVRLLLLSRERGGGKLLDPVVRLRGQASAHQTKVIDARKPVTAASDVMTSEQRLTLYNEATAHFRRAWFGTDAIVKTTATPDLTLRDTPLDVLFEAFDTALTQETGATSGTKPPVERVLDHEARYWRRTAPDTLDNKQRRLAIMLATLTGADDLDAADRLLGLVHGGGPGHRSERITTAEWLHEMYHGERYINPLRPDRLGEALISDVLVAAGPAAVPLLTEIADTVADAQLDRMLGVLTRLCVTDVDVRSAVAEHLWLRHDELVRRSTAQRPERSGRNVLAASAARLLVGAVVGNLLVISANGTPRQRGSLADSYYDLAVISLDRGDSGTAAQLSRQALTILEKLVDLHPEVAGHRAALARVCLKLGRAVDDQGETVLAEKHLRRALTVFEELSDSDPSNTDRLRDVSLALLELGDLARRNGNYIWAEQWQRRALTIARELADTDPNDLAHCQDLAVIYERLGRNALAVGDTEEAEWCFGQSLAFTEILVETDPENTSLRRDLVLSYSQLGDLAVERGDTAGALDHFRRALRKAKDIADADPQDTRIRSTLAWTHASLGDVQRSSGDLTNAKFNYERAVRGAEALVSEAPTNQRFRRELSVFYSKLGSLAQSDGESDTAEDIYRRKVEVEESLAGAEPHNRRAQQALHSAYSQLAGVVRGKGDTVEAEELYRQALTLSQELADANPDSSHHRIDVSWYHSQVGDLALLSGDVDTADRNFRSALALSRQNLDTDPENPVYRREVSQNCFDLGEIASARIDSVAAKRWYSRALGYDEGLYETDPHDPGNGHSLALTCNRLGGLAEDRGDLVEAEHCYRRALIIRERLLAEQPGNEQRREAMRWSSAQLGALLRTTGDLEQSEYFLRQAISLGTALVTDFPGATPYRTALIRAQLLLGYTLERGGDLPGVARCMNQVFGVLADMVAGGSLDPEARRLSLLCCDLMAEIAQEQGVSAWLETSLEQARPLLRTWYEENPTNTDHRNSLVQNYTATAGLAFRRGDPAEADTWCRLAVGLVEDFVRSEHRNSEHRAELALTYLNLGTAAAQNGDSIRAEQFFHAGAEFDLEVRRASPENMAFRLTLTSAYMTWAAIAVDAGTTSRLLGRALAVVEEMIEREPENHRFLALLLATCRQLGEMETENGNTYAAQRYYERAVVQWENRPASRTADNYMHRTIATIYEHIGDIARRRGVLTNAENLYRLALDQHLHLVEVSSDGLYRQDLSGCYTGLGEIYSDRMDINGARYWFLEALSIDLALVAESPDSASYLNDLWVSYSRLAGLAGKIHDDAEAKNWYIHALTEFERLSAARPHDTRCRRYIWLCTSRLGEMSRARGEYADTEMYYKRALFILREFAATEPNNRDYQVEIAWTCGTIAWMAHHTGDTATASTFARRALDLRTLLYNEDQNSLDAATRLAAMYNLARVVGPTSTEYARNQIIMLLTPFEQAGRLDADGMSLLRWARGL